MLVVAFREADLPSAPVADPRVDQPARDERRPLRVVGDGGHEGVVLVSEVRVEAGPVTQ